MTTPVKRAGANVRSNSSPGLVDSDASLDEAMLSLTRSYDDFGGLILGDFGHRFESSGVGVGDSVTVAVEV
jgi:hypothetical protein